MSSHTRVSLAQQLAQLNQPAPPDFDPEDVDVTTNTETEDASDERSKAGRGHYLDVGPSSLRSNLHESLNDLKYEGVRVSRKQLEDNDDKLVSDDMPGDNTDDTLSRPVTSDEETESSEEEDDGKSDTVDAQGIPQRGASKTPEDSEAAPQVSNDQDPSSTLKRAREEERKKGKAVSKQLALFDGLLDARIRLQKCGTSVNRLPDSSKIPIYLDNTENRIAVNKLLHETLSLADHLFDLQELIAANEGFQFPNRKRRKIDPDSDIDCDWEEEVQESASYFAELESTFHAHLLSTLQKWSDKVLAIAPSALLPSNRTKFSNSKNPNQVKSAVQLVDEALLERKKLISRTRVWRGMDTRLDSDTSFDPNSNTTLSEPIESRGSSDTAAADVFDDTDFYQSLLRDVIDARSSSSGTTAVSGLEGLASNWRRTQKERKKARQKTIDTRASKGRKLRFEVHEKMQNFMAPAPQPGGGVPWHEEQIDELFASLLGKSFPDINGSVHPEDSENRAGMDVIDAGEALKGGFRVFG